MGKLMGNSSGLSAADIVTLLLSGAAFVTSVASLYLTSLKRADIEFDVVLIGGELGRGG